jgi:hypothetical protein
MPPKAAKHIAFFYKEERLSTINRMLQEVTKYPFQTDVFIHTNTPIPQSLLHKQTSGQTHVIVHDVTGIDPFKLTWLCRPLLKSQLDEYDVFIYVEDDILIPSKAMDYWLSYKDLLLSVNCNLGFIRVEIDQLGEHMAADLHTEDCYPRQLTKLGQIHSQKFIVNDVNNYTAFWIYDKKEFKRFLESKYYTIYSIKGHGVREASAIGLHNIRDPDMKWYTHTLIPLTQNTQLDERCKVYHIPNTFVNDPGCLFSCLPFSDIVCMDEASYRDPLKLLEKKQRKFLTYGKSMRQPPPA